jgi:hypothetical protein
MDSLTFENALTALQILAICGSAAVSVYLFRRAADAKALDAVRDSHTRASTELKGQMSTLSNDLRVASVRDSEMHTRISVLETKMNHVPTHGDLTLIKNELRDVNGTLSAVNERSESTVDMVRSIQKYLMEKKSP